jgi:hypothetical protein
MLALRPMMRAVYGCGFKQHYSPDPKVLSANIVFFRLAQKYLVQIWYFRPDQKHLVQMLYVLPGPKVLSANIVFSSGPKVRGANIAFFVRPKTTQCKYCIFARPKGTQCKYCIFRLAQKYLVQTFSPDPKALSANIAFFAWLKST